MKLSKNIILGCMLLAVTSLSAQVRRATPANNTTAAKGTNDITVRAKSFIETSEGNNNTGSQWSRVIYRELDLNEGPNASLYFPEEPMDGQSNLFRVMFGLMADGKIKTYEYLDGREIFTEKYELNTKELLDKFYIIYEETVQRGKAAPIYKIDESDVPCSEVKSYFIKERWNFDQTGSKMVCKIEAICPVLHRSGDFGVDVTKYPMFWVKYDAIKPYLLNNRIMSDGDNNVLRYNLDDFFVMRQYKGDIYKTMNLQNKTLMQLYPDPDSLKVAQDKIEAELLNFGSALWVKETPLEETPKKGQKKTSVKEVENNKDSESDNNVDSKEENDEKTIRRTNPRSNDSETKSSSSRSKQSSSSAPVRSVRRTR